MGYFFWDAIPRKADDQTRIAAFVAAELAKQDELSELNDVNIPAPNDGDVLTWSPPKWVAAAPGDGVGDLSPARFRRIGGVFFSAYALGYYLSAKEAIGVNQLYAVAWPTPIQITVDQIGIRIDTGAAGALRLGIYDDDNGYPDNLILDAGVVDTTTSGNKMIAIDQVLPAGLYWLALIANAGPLIKYTTSYCAAPLGLDPALSNAVYKIARSYGVLPDPFPGGAAAWNKLWGVGLRRSA